MLRYLTEQPANFISVTRVIHIEISGATSEYVAVSPLAATRFSSSYIA